MSYDLMNPAIIPPADDQGHSAKVTVRVQPDWLREIDMTIKHHGLEYCNRGDFIRDAIRRHFQWIETWIRDHNEEIYGSLWGKIRLTLNSFEQDRYQQGFAAILTSLRERVNTFMKLDAPTEAVRHILNAVQILKQMSDGYWRNTHLTAILNEHGALLESAQKVDMVLGIINAANEEDEESEEEEGEEL